MGSKLPLLWEEKKDFDSLVSEEEFLGNKAPMIDAMAQIGF